MNENELTPEQQAELDDKIFAAKKRAERAGYKVIMPGEAGNTAPAARPRYTMSRQAYAQRTGGPANRLSMAGQLSQLAQAAKTAEDAGYKVRKATPEERVALKAQQPTPMADQLSKLAQAAKTAENAGYKVRKAAPAAPQTSRAEPEKKPNPYFAAAARFCKQED